ncbi:hypothetical protein [Alcanivorax hongdengensis]|nr:hypothetical protein [Alcanivorax hongdengensis]
MLRFFGALLFSLVLAACGGGGGGSSSNNDSGNDGAKKSATKYLPEGASKPTSEQAGWISGVYDAETGSDNDEIYYYIDEEGVVHTYDYMNDGVDSSGNCYAVAANGKANYQLEGKQLYWVESKQEFAVNLVDDVKTVVTLGVDGNHDIDKLVLAGSFSGSTGLFMKLSSINGKEVNINLALRAAPVSSPTITDIKSALCE